MLLVTHDVDEAIVLADRVIVLEHGVVSSTCASSCPATATQADPAFAALRSQLLAALGVEDDHQVRVEDEQAYAARRAS